MESAKWFGMQSVGALEPPGLDVAALRALFAEVEAPPCLVCPTCGGAKGPRQTQCRLCYMRARYHGNAELRARALEQQREWRQRNPDKARAWTERGKAAKRVRRRGEG